VLRPDLFVVWYQEIMIHEFQESSRIIISFSQKNMAVHGNAWNWRIVGKERINIDM